MSPIVRGGVSTRPEVKSAPESTRPESTRPGVFSERLVTYSFNDICF